MSPHVALARLTGLKSFLRSSQYRGTWEALRRKLKLPFLPLKTTLASSGTLIALKITSLSRTPVQCTSTTTTSNIVLIDLPHATTKWHKLTSYLRFLYLILLFSPAILLHFLNFLFPFHFLLSLKWIYFRFALQQSGPAFIKLGQWASTRRDILSEETCDSLSYLQRDCTPHPWESTRDSLEKALGDGWEEMFISVDHAPIGCGCVAQVYSWDLKAEYAPEFSSVNKPIPVAVKVLHPGIEESVLRDVSLMNLAARFIDYVFPDVYWISLKECVEEFGTIMKKQVS